jgi:hypothetical protein
MYTSSVNMSVLYCPAITVESLEGFYQNFGFYIFSLSNLSHENNFRIHKNLVIPNHF